ncbi:regulator of protease activity HflC (stomatin/prohibitin superfamily) [Halospina denitrificans]|uniref:Regulator of protease activity HflC (Stomatin/prohibitin superfamily) n=1 Tax=Halospina denitrificans TaxID=332522 RepID=A0A4R7JRL6_9GAMM|nr:SPFH domain-containing protein [Halospina denitrificans]TDT40386.1 regulator of protease activity HflC (stomatin/prohibitin superfamily) [Halospina denitrificans]
MMEASLIISVVLAALVIYVLAKGIRIVQQSEAMVIERLGSYSRTLEPGINIIIPFVDKPRSIKVRRYKHGAKEPVIMEEERIDRRETVLDFPAQSMITKDNVTVSINGAIYYQVIDPANAVYKVENFIQAIEVLAKTTLRALIGQKDLDEIFSNRDEINAHLEQTMDEAGNKWGIKATRVEIQDVDMPSEIEDAMRMQMTAERNRRASVTEANGKREAEIQVAEGEKQAAILRAEGDKESAVLRAEGEQEAITRVVSVASEREDFSTQQVVNYLLALEYLKTLPDVAKEGDRVFLPLESTQITGALGGIGELLKGGRA